VLKNTNYANCFVEGLFRAQSGSDVADR